MLELIDKEPNVYQHDNIKRIVFTNNQLTGQNSLLSKLLNPPLFRVNNEQPLQHIIIFDHEKNKSTLNCACEIWGKIDDYSVFTYLTTEKKSPYTIIYSKIAKDKNASYRLRWINSKNEYSPWSEIINAKINS